METPQNTRASLAPAAKPIKRRHVTAGLAWSAPALALTVAAPAQAASSQPCGYTVDFEGTQGTADKVSQFEAVSDTGQIITVVVESTPTSCTALTRANLSTRSDYALAGQTTTTTCGEVFQETGPRPVTSRSTSTLRWMAARVSGIATPLTAIPVRM